MISSHSLALTSEFISRPRHMTFIITGQPVWNLALFSQTLRRLPHTGVQEPRVHHASFFKWVSPCSSPSSLSACLLWSRVTGLDGSHLHQHQAHRVCLDQKVLSCGHARNSIRRHKAKECLQRWPSSAYGPDAERRHREDYRPPITSPIW